MECRKNAPIPRSSTLKALKPMMGAGLLLRLGGRLRNAAIEYSEKHPVILPKHRISDLLIDHVHHVTLHDDTQLTLRTLRQECWIVSCRNRLRCIVRDLCTSAKNPIQLMGDLPHVNPSPSFSHTGVDYAGSFGIMPFVGPGQRSRKHYMALFVCLAIKAIHLECVEDYATTGFLVTFCQFVSRCGLHV